MKKIVTTVFMAAVLCSTSCFASESKIVINEITVKDGLIIVQAENGLDNETLLTATVMNEDSVLPTRSKLCYIDQRPVAGNTAVTYEIGIFDEKVGDSGSGKFTFKLQNTDKEFAEVKFDYANADGINRFLDALKNAGNAVTDSSKAYEKLMPIIIDDENAGAVFCIGLNLEQFSLMSADVKNDTLNILYSQLSSVNSTDKLITEFAGSLGVAVFNSGEKIEGIKSTVVKYDGKELDLELSAGMTAAMSSSYNTVAEFEKACVTAYGLEQINLAKLGNLANTLGVFKNETGECSANITALLGLPATQSNKAYEYIILAIDSQKLTSTSALDVLLKNAYDNVTRGNIGGGGGGTGDNRTGIKRSTPTVSAGVQSVPTKPITEQTTQNAAFTDLPAAHWANESVSWLKNKGVVNGNASNEFEPDRAVTREEFAKMLVSVCGIGTDEQAAEFADITPDAWYIPYIGAALKAGIVNGIDEERFGIGMNITRQDMAVMTERAVKAAGRVLDEKRAYSGFADDDKIADYAASAINSLYKAEIINGMGGNNLFEPYGDATRAEAASIIYKAFKGDK